MDGGRLRRPHLLGIYFMSKMHTKTIQKIQKAYIKTYEEDVKIYKDIENSQVSQQPGLLGGICLHFFVWF